VQGLISRWLFYLPSMGKEEASNNNLEVLPKLLILGDSKSSDERGGSAEVWTGAKGYTRRKKIYGRANK